MFSALLRTRSQRLLIERLHAQIMAAVRKPLFYRDLQVADTLEGRFEILVLHVALTVRRLEALGPETAALAQALTDSVFRHLDIALRETGVSDIGVPKKMKKLAGGYLGRALAYAAALEAGQDEGLAVALARNVYGGNREPSDPEVAALAHYVRAFESSLSSAPASVFLAGELPAPPEPSGAER